MKCPVLPCALLLSLLPAPASPTPASPTPASPTPADTTHFCLPIDFDRWESDRPAAAAKPLADLPAAEPGTVRLVYFLPNDRPFRGAVVDSMKSVMRRIQGFYREQMQAHGLGESTFPLETDAGGEPLVHRVDGQHPEIHYEEDTFKLLDEMGPAFDTRTNVYIVVVDNSNNLIGNGGVYSGGAGSRRGKNGGVGLFPAASVASGSWELAAHELGQRRCLHHVLWRWAAEVPVGVQRGIPGGPSLFQHRRGRGGRPIDRRDLSGYLSGGVGEGPHPTRRERSGRAAPGDAARPNSGQISIEERDWTSPSDFSR